MSQPTSSTYTRRSTEIEDDFDPVEEQREKTRAFVRFIPSLLRDTWSWLRHSFSFWVYITVVAAGAFLYFFVIAQPFYVSEATISLRHKANVSSGVGSILNSVMATGASSSELATLTAYIESPEMMRKLNAKFDLRKIYSTEDRNPFTRIKPDSNELDVLARYQSLIDLTERDDVEMITVDVYDANSARAKAMNDMIINEAERFMNQLSLEIQQASLKYARDEFNAAMVAVQKAGPVDRSYAEQRLSTAQSALAVASGVASDQQVFLVRISNPTQPPVVTSPAAWTNTGATIVVAALLYLIISLIFANIVDHRKV
ncbi:MAG TPA: hypothetical protein VHL34_02260 [Rhizomicrobium sp.]|jgi:capsule polysaccharide export protein KpsE/RkpR|nr:hypothetical protein [Rhizomicrobium sp.]